MSIGINWKAVWKPVWKAVWKPAATQPTTSAPGGGGGRKKKRGSLQDLRQRYDERRDELIRLGVLPAPAVVPEVIAISEVPASIQTKAPGATTAREDIARRRRRDDEFLLLMD